MQQLHLLREGVEPIEGYRLRRYLGRGGFGEVWEAEAPGGLTKAVKIAPVDVAEEGIACREWEGLRKIRDVRHPYLLSIERFEIIGHHLVIVMEMAERSLADRFNECVRQGLPGIPRVELMRYLSESAEVLDLLAHRHGLQHLDVKPENLFLSGDHVKVGDFGLVQPRDTNLQRSAIAISPPYAPPELFDGRISASADQYSLAVTYQELLTGTRPYRGNDVRTVMMQHLRSTPDLGPLPEYDRAVLGRALQRDPENRFASCQEFVETLRRVPATSIISKHGSPIMRTTSSGRITSSGTLSGEISEDPASGTRSRSLKPARSMYVKPRPARETERVEGDTVPSIGDDSVDRRRPTQTQAEGETVDSTFLAFLPLEIYAHKLRGFLDAMNAQILQCESACTVVYLGPQGWFGRRSNQGLYLMIETFARHPHTGFRVVDATVWSPNRSWNSSELGWRGMLLIRCLRNYLMAVDPDEPSWARTDAEVRAAILA